MVQPGSRGRAKRSDKHQVPVAALLAPGVFARGSCSGQRGAALVRRVPGRAACFLREAAGAVERHEWLNLGAAHDRVPSTDSLVKRMQVVLGTGLLRTEYRVLSTE